MIDDRVLNVILGAMWFIFGLAIFIEDMTGNLAGLICMVAASILVRIR